MEKSYFFQKCCQKFKEKNRPLFPWLIRPGWLNGQTWFSCRTNIALASWDMTPNHWSDLSPGVRIDRLGSRGMSNSKRHRQLPISHLWCLCMHSPCTENIMIDKTIGSSLESVLGWFWTLMHTCTSEAGNGLLAFLLLSNCIHRLQSQVIERVLFVRIIYYYLLGWTNELKNVSLETKINANSR